jgi:site-specific DNA-methyltransferase (cytosine-N4-specific)
MQERLKPMHISELIRQKFKLSSPVFLSGDPDSLKFELKPYLQPFEQELAMRELRALLGTRAEIIEEFGYHVVHTNKPEDFFRERLTYWQRVGRVSLEPTVQKALELTQNGISETHVPKKLHKARRLRYGPHDLHEYRGKSQA